MTTQQRIRFCIDTWIQCEHLLLTIQAHPVSFSKRTAQVLDECANVCLGTVEALKRQTQNLSNVALLCVGICEECAELCERYHNESFLNCAQACRQCSQAIAALATPAL